MQFILQLSQEAGSKLQQHTQIIAVYISLAVYIYVCAIPYCRVMYCMCGVVKRHVIDVALGGYEGVLGQDNASPTLTRWLTRIQFIHSPSDCRLLYGLCDVCGLQTVLHASS
jgi:hypothetical protein